MRLLKLYACIYILLHDYNLMQNVIFYFNELKKCPVKIAYVQIIMVLFEIHHLCASSPCPTVIGLDKQYWPTVITNYWLFNPEFTLHISEIPLDRHMPVFTSKTVPKKIKDIGTEYRKK